MRETVNMLVLGKLDGTFAPVVTWEDYELVKGLALRSIFLYPCIIHAAMPKGDVLSQ